MKIIEVMRKLIIGWLLVIGIVSVGRACEHCAALAVGNVVPAKVKYFGLKDVRLLDSPFKNAMDRNAAWMLEMDMDRLLSNFLKNAGLEPKGESYGSWESMGIAGHTLGHYLSAVAQQYASTGDERFKQRVDYIVHELDSCQQYFVNGFIGGMPGGDRVFKQVKKGIIRSAGFDLNGLWVPWYNEHKTMMGLNDAYLLAGNKTAKKVLVNLADYLVDVLAGLTDEQVQTMLNCEFGGMNEAFAQVYALTGDKKYLVDETNQQVEHLSGTVSDVMVSVTINQAAADGTDAAALYPHVARAAGIATADQRDKISVLISPFYQADEPVLPVPEGIPAWVIYAAAGGGVLFLVLLLVILLLGRRRRKRRKELEAAGLAAVAQTETAPLTPQEGADIMNLQTEKSMELRKDVRKFAEDNPEIAAQMVKSWLREGDGE